MKRMVTILFSMLLLIALLACSEENDSKKEADEDSESDGTDGVQDEFRPGDLHEMADALATAIDGKGEPGQTEIAVVPNLLCEFWIPNQIGVGRASSEIGCLTIFSAPADGKTSEQIEILEDKISSRFSGIAVSPTDPTAIEPIISAAAAENVNVITFDSDSIPGSKRALYLGTINRSAGRQAGMKMAELLGGAGKVAVFAGAFAEANNASERLAGIKEAFASTEIELLDPYADNVDFEVARANVQAALSEHEDLAGIIGIWAYNGPIAADVVLDKHREGDVQIVAFDLESDTINYLRDGTIAAAVGQRPYWMGYLSVYILYAMDALGVDETLRVLTPWVGRTDKDVIDTGTDLVTNESVEAYQAYLESLGISSS